MRSILFLALAVATPAIAQDAENRMTGVRETDDGYACHAVALPDLNLTHDWRGGDRSAWWHMPARDAGAGTQEMLVNFAPNDGAAFGTETTVRGFQLEMPANPLSAKPKSAHLRIDGIADATMLTVDPELSDTKSVTIAVLERQRSLLATRLMSASIVEIDLTDATATTLRRYSWDVRKLRRAPELLQLVNWSCN